MFEDAFHAPWYNYGPEVKSSLKIISVVSRQPIILAPFRSKQFDMSLPTFIMVSFAHLFRLAYIHNQNLFSIFLKNKTKDIAMSSRQRTWPHS